MSESTEQDQIDIDLELQFHQEWTQWEEEIEKQQALEDYVNALCKYYGNLKESS